MPIQRMVDTSSAMHNSNQMVIARSMSHRPINTIKAYTTKQEEWKASSLYFSFPFSFRVVNKLSLN